MYVSSCPRLAGRVATPVAARYAPGWQRAKARPLEEGPAMKRIVRWGAACAAVATLSLGIAIPAGASGGSHVVGHHSLLPGAGGSTSLPLLFPPPLVPPIIPPPVC